MSNFDFQNNNDSHMLKNDDYLTLQRVLLQLRYIEILTWANDFERAAALIRSAGNRYRSFLQRGRDARSRMTDYARVTQENKGDLAISGLSARYDFFQEKFASISNEISADVELDSLSAEYVYTYLQLETAWTTVRAYRLDDVVISRQIFVAVLQSAGFVINNSDNPNPFPLYGRLFRNNLFAEIAVFDVNHFEVRIAVSDERDRDRFIENLINQMNQTR